MSSHLIGLLLGTEEDWPAAFEHLLSRYSQNVGHVRLLLLTIEHVGRADN